MKKLIFTLVLQSVSIILLSQTKLDSLILIKINEYRAENKLSPLIFSKSAYNVAHNQSQYNSLIGELSHDQSSKDKALLKKFKAEPNFKARFAKFGIDTINPNYVIIENIALVPDTTTDKSESFESIADRVMTGWKNSPSHNQALLLNLISYVGVSNTIGTTVREIEGYDAEGNEYISIKTGKIYFISFDAYQ